MQRVIKENVFIMVAKFQKLGSTDLMISIETLIRRILCNTDDKGNLDADTLMDILDEFAGKDYVLLIKLKNDVDLSSDDKDYILHLIEKHEQDSV